MQKEKPRETEPVLLEASQILNLQELLLSLQQDIQLFALMMVTSTLRQLKILIPFCLRQKTHKSGLKLPSTLQTEASLPLVLTIPTSTCTMLMPTTPWQELAQSIMPLLLVSISQWTVPISDLFVTLMSSFSSWFQMVLKIHPVHQTLQELTGPPNTANSAGASMDFSQRELTELISMVLISTKTRPLSVLEMIMVWSRFSETLAERDLCQDVTELIQSMLSEPSSEEAVLPVTCSQWEDTTRQCSNGRRSSENEDQSINSSLSTSNS